MTAKSAWMLVLLAAFATTNLLAQGAAKTAKKAATASLQATLEKLETDGWTAFKNKDEKAFTALCAPGYTAVNADGKGEVDLNGTLQAMKTMNVQRFSLSGFKVERLGPTAAMVTYNASVTLGTKGGKTQDVKLAAMDVVVRHGGQWKALRYQESEVK